MSTTCNCETFTTEDGRHHITAYLNDQQPIAAAAPFGLSPRIPAPERMLVRDPQYQLPTVDCRENGQLHAKAIITAQFVMHGSCNFTTNSIQHEHEIINITYCDCCPEKYETYTGFFETLWTRSKPLDGINSLVN